MIQAERREVPRTDTRLNCFVMDGPAMEPARIHNQSAKGALIEVFGGFQPADTFDVMVNASEPARRGKVVRRNENLIGIIWID